MRESVVFRYTQQKGLVSIVIPTCNRESLIKETLQSAVDQTYKDIEIIVVNDHSSDQTTSVVNQYIAEGHKNVRLIDSDGYGACHARNVGLVNAKGEYIQFFDDDDIMCPNYIQKRLEVMQEKNLDYVSCDFDHFKDHIDNIIYKRRISETPHNIVAHIYHMNLPTQCFLLKRSVIDLIGGWDESVRRLQDMAYFHRLFLYDLRGGYLKDSLFKYRIHVNSITRNNLADSQIYAYNVIGREWKSEGKFVEVKRVLMLGKYKFLRDLFHEDIITFLKQTLMNIGTIIFVLFQHKVLRKKDKELLDNLI